MFIVDSGDKKMTLEEYRHTNKKTISEMVNFFGVSQMTLWRWENGKAIPRKEMIKKIEEWSNGQITPMDFYTKGE